MDEILIGQFEMKDGALQVRGDFENEEEAFFKCGDDDVGSGRPDSIHEGAFLFEDGVGDKEARKKDSVLSCAPDMECTFGDGQGIAIGRIEMDGVDRVRWRRVWRRVRLLMVLTVGRRDVMMFRKYVRLRPAIREVSHIAIWQAGSSVKNGN